MKHKLCFKKSLNIILAVCIVISSMLLSACNLNVANNLNNDYRVKPDTITILCTGFSQYDWIKNIIGNANENINVSLLFKNGVDIHNYQPTPDDIIKISHSDLLVYNGSEGDAAIEKILETSAKDTKTFNCMSHLGNDALYEDVSVAVGNPRGHSHEHTHDFHENNHEHNADDIHNINAEMDEHFWLSLRYAGKMCSYLCDEIITLDPKNKEVYKSNLNNYLKELSDLDVLYQDTISQSKNDTVIFADRFPFLYLANDYDIKCFAAFSGCSTETSASFKTIIALANKVKEIKPSHVVIIDNSTEKTANAVIKASDMKNDVKIATLYSLQSVTDDDLQNNITYLSAMKKNLDALNKVLN